MLQILEQIKFDIFIWYVDWKSILQLIHANYPQRILQYDMEMIHICEWPTDTPIITPHPPQLLGPQCILTPEHHISLH
jgi:hypothetical protein